MNVSVAGFYSDTQSSNNDCNYEINEILTTYNNTIQLNTTIQ